MLLAGLWRVRGAGLMGRWLWDKVTASHRLAYSSYSGYTAHITLEDWMDLKLGAGESCAARYDPRELLSRLLPLRRNIGSEHHTALTPSSEAWAKLFRKRQQHLF